MILVDPGAPESLAARAAGAFAERFDRECAVVGRAPGRVNLVGEHTDYNGGRCLPLALPHATYAAAAPREDHRVRLVSTATGVAWSGTLEDLVPGRLEGWAAYAGGVLWALRENGLVLPGCDVLVDSTLPVGAGLSSSAALECAVAVVACALAGEAPESLDADRRLGLVAACMRAEGEVAGAPTGGLDQSAALLSEEGTALLLDFDAGTHHPVPIDLADAGLLVVDTRVAHGLADGAYEQRRRECEAAAAELGLDLLSRAQDRAWESLADEVLRRRTRHVVTEGVRVGRAASCLATGDVRGLGRLLTASHASLRDDFEVSSPELDAVVDAALGAGALGARMTGGGFGGSALVLAPADLVHRVAEAVGLAFDRRGWRAPSYLLAGTGAAPAGLL